MYMWYKNLIVSGMFEYESYKHEIRRYSDGKYGQRGYLATETDAQEQVEQHDVKQIVGAMGTTKAYAVLDWSLLSEGETGREVIID